MPVTTKHEEYQEHEHEWQKCRDAIAGEQAIKDRDLTAGAAMETGKANLRPKPVAWGPMPRAYLPQLTGQDLDEYEDYKARARWYGATARTLDGLLGAAFRKRPVVQVPKSMETILDEIDEDGLPIGMFAKRVVREVLSVGRFGVLLDLPDDNVREEYRQPYWIGFATEQVINWKTIAVGRQQVLSLVVLAQYGTEDGEDEYEAGKVRQYRVLRLDESGYYVHELYRENEESSTQVELVAAVTPTIRGQRVDYLPFVMFGAQYNSASVQSSPLLPLIDTNIHHYRLSADLYHGLHFTAMPWPVVIGGDPDQETYRIGAQHGVNLPSGADAKYVEFSGAGLGSIREEMSTLKDDMALLGARLLRPQKREAETAEALRLQQSGEDATLADVIDTCDRGLTRLLKWTAEWLGLPPDKIEAGLNRDFFDSTMSADDALKWMQIVQAGGLSEDDLYSLYKRGEVLDASVTLNAFKAKLAEEREKSNAAFAPPFEQAQDEQQGEEKATVQ